MKHKFLKILHQSSKRKDASSKKKKKKEKNKPTREDAEGAFNK